MDSIDGWSRDGAGSNGVHSLWSHDERDLEVRVAKAPDETWDLLLQRRVIANRDRAEEAARRALELMQDLPVD